jgi:hypothetical protein
MDEYKVVGVREATAEEIAQAEEYEKSITTHLAMGHCPHGGGGLRLEEWIEPWGKTIACGVCDCFGFDPTDHRLRCNPAGGYHSTPHKGCLLR